MSWASLKTIGHVSSGLFFDVISGEELTWNAALPLYLVHFLLLVPKTCDCYVNQTEIFVCKDNESEAELSINRLSFHCFAHQNANQSHMI